MQLISLNTWGGRAGSAALLEFFRTYREVDCFCLQEIWSAPYEHLEGRAAGGVAIDHTNILTEGLQEISQILADTHVAYFHPHHLENYGLLLLVKKEYPVVAVGDVFVHKERGFVPVGDVGLHARNVQYVTVETPTGRRTLMNFHGLWNGKGKGDSPDRLEQSDRMIQFFETLGHPYIVAGDFNLLPDTTSIRKFTDAGLRDLIHEYAIPSTRTKHYCKAELHADYAFVSVEIAVRDFRVLPEVVSDHAPLWVEFE